MLISSSDEQELGTGMENLEIQSRICQRCEDVDFAPAFAVHDAKVIDPETEVEIEAGSDCGIFISDVSRLNDDDTVKASNCAFCKLLHGFWTSYPAGHDEPLALRAFPYRKTVRQKGWIVPSTEQTGDGINPALIYLAVVPAMDTDSYLRETHVAHDRTRRVQQFGYLFISPNNAAESQQRTVEPVSPTFDFTIAKAWLAYCVDHHANILSPYAPLRTHLRVIDCETLEIVSETSMEDYVTLSYVWGPSTESENATAERSGVRNGRRLPSTFPSIVEDAMTATKALGYRYLWVDKYCIDHKDPEDVQKQISNMALIYRESVVTLIAASCLDFRKLPGVGKNVRTSQPSVRLGDYTITSSMMLPTISSANSKWYTRGWTFQEEYLARRLLVFTDEQVYFQCPEALCQESLRLSFRSMKHVDTDRHENSYTNAVDFEAQNLPYIPRRNSIPSGRLTVGYGQELKSLRTCIGLYSARELTYERDILRAFAGVLIEAENHDKFPLFHIYGLPLTKPTDTESSLGFQMSLLWVASTAERNRFSSPPPTSRVREGGWPSWSWPSFKGPIFYPWHDDEETHFRFHNTEIEFEIGPDSVVNLKQVTGSILCSRNQPRTLWIKSRYWNLPFDDFHGHRLTEWGFMFVHGPSTIHITIDQAEKPAEELKEALTSGRWRFLEMGQITSLPCYVSMIVEQKGDSWIRMGIAVIDNTDTLEAFNLRKEDAYVRLV